MKTPKLTDLMPEGAKQFVRAAAAIENELRDFLRLASDIERSAFNQIKAEESATEVEA